VEIRAATWDDLEPVHDLLTTRARAAFGVAQTSLEHLRHRWEAPAFELHADSWVAAESGAIIGYAALDSTQELDHAAVDDGIGDALLECAAKRGRERDFAWIACTVVPEDRPLHALVTRNAFELERETWRMWRTLEGDVPTPQWSEDLTVRTYTADDGEAVHALLDEMYGGWDRDYVARSHSDWLAFMTEHDEFDPALWFLVERDTALLGCALHWRESRGDGWVKDIVVRSEERGRGIGTALLQRGLAASKERGAARVGLKVDSSNPTGAPRLYAQNGFVTDRRYGIWKYLL